jgi:phthalate 4,5-cis-dihydrodiol dehydrogenase
MSMRLGFVGFGAQAQENLVPCCQALPGIEIVAVCDRNPGRREDALQWVMAQNVYSNPHDMIDSCPLDALIVACYPTDHYEIAMHAIERGLPVLVEKPPAPSSGHLAKMTDLARARNLTTGVGMNFRYARATQRLKTLAEGQVNSITLRHLCNKPTTFFWDHTCLLKSFLYSQSIHSLDFLLNLCGPVSSISTAGGVNGNLIVLTVLLNFKSGASASLFTSNASPHFVFDFDAIALGRRHISSSALWSIKVSEVGKSYTDGETKRWTDSWEPSPLDSGFVRSGYAGQLTEFLSAVRERRDSTISFASVQPVYACMDEIERQVRADAPGLIRRAS